MGERVRIVLQRSLIGTTEDQRATVRTLGLRRRGQSVVREWSPELEGVIRKVRHLVAVEPVEEGEHASQAR
ncbi:MAG: 50S ribosomal protein L30 [Armatimonadetes bacterium]|nr:50S ribosomal protein L30 [Armatimonadota bacterium]MDW8153602.1 50S ribosomal protein L30 [Armatimonadota bacterium]